MTGCERGLNHFPFGVSQAARNRRYTVDHWQSVQRCCHAWRAVGCGCHSSAIIPTRSSENRNSLNCGAFGNNNMFVFLWLAMARALP